MRGNDNNRVLFLIEEDSLDTAGDFADLRTVLKVISKADWARGASKEEQGVGTVLVGILIDL